MLSNSKLKKNINKLLLLNSNPYIHGTTSAILPNLARSKFTLMDVETLLRDYQLAPLTGEVTKGGYELASDKGLLRFGRVAAEKGGGYNLDRIVNEYANNKDSAFMYASRSRKLYSDINLILIWLGRQKLTKEGFSEDLNSYKKYFHSAILYLKITAVLDKFIFRVDLSLLSEIERSEIYDAIYTHLNRENLDEAIQKLSAKFDFDPTCPSQEDLEKILALFQLPKISIILKGFRAEPTVATLALTNVFTFANQNPPTRALNIDPEDYFRRYSRQAGNYDLSNLLEDYMRGRYDHFFMESISTSCLEQIDLLRVKWALLEKVNEYHKLELTHEENEFIKQSFPIVFIGHKDELFEKNQLTYIEYIAKNPLVLGQDIVYVATDTNNNAAILTDYFARNELSHVSVITFFELNNSYKKSKQQHFVFSNQTGISDSMTNIVNNKVKPVSLHP